jgi:hypothetical protein
LQDRQVESGLKSDEKELVGNRTKLAISPRLRLDAAKLAEGGEFAGVIIRSAVPTWAVVAWPAVGRHKGGLVMSRRFWVVAFLGLAVGLLPARHSEGAVVSPRNPYRSFNISGINYASMKWEKQHRRSTYHRSGGIFRRR